MSEERERMTTRKTDEPGDDVEGHKQSSKAQNDEGDVEGHIRNKGATDDPYGGDDDVEGHIRSKA
jgi:hypothetical protein